MKPWLIMDTNNSLINWSCNYLVHRRRIQTCAPLLKGRTVPLAPLCSNASQWWWKHNYKARLLCPLSWDGRTTGTTQLFRNLLEA